VTERVEVTKDNGEKRYGGRERESQVENGQLSERERENES